MQPFDTNMRAVRSFVCEDDGKRYFTVNKDEEKGKVKDTICNHCGRRLDKSCLIWDFVTHTEEQTGACLKVHGCQHYEPVLTFKPPLEGFFGTFTTFRAGESWYNRLVAGRVVSLYDTDAQTVFARAVVDWVATGPIEDMLKDFAHLNHSQKAQDRVGAADRMRSRLKSLYGPAVVGPNKKVSVICMTELTDDQATVLRNKELSRAERRRGD